MNRRVVVTVEWEDESPWQPAAELGRVLDYLGQAISEIQDYYPRTRVTVAIAPVDSMPKGNGGREPSQAEPSEPKAEPKRSHKKKPGEKSSGELSAQSGGATEERTEKRGPGRPRKIRNGLVDLPKSPTTPPADDRQLAITPSVP